MKKTRLSKIIVLFFLCGIGLSIIIFNTQENFFVAAAFSFEKQKEGSFEKSKSSIAEGYIIEVDGKIFKYKTKQLLKNQNRTDFQKKLRVSENIEAEVLKLQKMGLSLKEAVLYIYPETKTILSEVKKEVENLPTADSVMVVSNKCEAYIEEGKNGKYLNEQKFFKAIFNELKAKQKTIKVSLKTSEFNYEKIEKNEFQEKSCFSTNFETSSEPRKNNIAVALKKFDGLVLEEGEILRFNSVTGVRNEAAGYKLAKIISGGTFVEGYGGGVCQVSTTVYNACLLSGLEILEVHNHSLPVSYVEPSFDAMVNMGSSDLVVRNNSGGQLVFTTSSENDVCRVKIFGRPNKHKIMRISEKTKIIEAEPEEVITDYKKLGDYNLLPGEEKRISYAKDGFCSNGYLNYYDNEGVLVETKKIRSNKYNATRGIIIKNTQVA